MARGGKPETNAVDVLEKQATRIGYQKMLDDLQELLNTGLSEAQRILIIDQQANIKDRLAQLSTGGGA